MASTPLSLGEAEKKNSSDPEVCLFSIDFRDPRYMKIDDVYMYVYL